MAIDLDFVLAMGDGIASVAPADTACPTGLAALNTPWVDLGALSTDGIAETLGETRTSFKRWGNISTFKTVVTDQSKTFDVTFLESNPNVLGLFYKVAVPSPSADGANEVQTVTITGAPTGGTFSLTFKDQTTPALAFNATASAVQTALQALSTVGAGNATVAGSAGGPYTVTFAGALANTDVETIDPVGSFTGGTSPAIATAVTTPGGSGAILTVTDDTTGTTDLRAFTLDILEGTNHIRFYLPHAEITARKNPAYKTDTITEYGVTITAYPDVNNVSVRREYRLDAI